MRNHSWKMQNTSSSYSGFQCRPTDMTKYWWHEEVSKNFWNHSSNIIHSSAVWSVCSRNSRTTELNTPINIWLQIYCGSFPFSVSKLVWLGADCSSCGSILHSFQSFLSSLKVAPIWYSGDTFPVAYFVDVCRRCAGAAFPNRHTNPAFSLVAFLCQTRQTNPEQHLLEKCCFDMTATPSCYCHESTWHVSNDVATSAMQLFFFPPTTLLTFWFPNFLFFCIFHLCSPPLSSTSHSSHW